MDGHNSTTQAPRSPRPSVVSNANSIRLPPLSSFIQGPHTLSPTATSTQGYTQQQQQQQIQQIQQQQQLQQQQQQRSPYTEYHQPPLTLQQQHRNQQYQQRNQYQQPYQGHHRVYSAAQQLQFQQESQQQNAYLQARRNPTTLNKSMTMPSTLPNVGASLYLPSMQQQQQQQHQQSQQSSKAYQSRAIPAYQPSATTTAAAATVSINGNRGSPNHGSIGSVLPNVGLPQIVRWKTLPQSSADRISIQEARLMTAASKAAAVRAASLAVSNMAKTLWRLNKRQNMAADLPQAPLSATPKRRRAAAKSNSPSGGDKTSRPRITPNISMSVGPMTCVNCGTTRTPLWRRDPRNRPICNKCGLYLKSYGKMRPLSLKRALKHNADPINTPVSVAAAASGCGCSSGGGCGGHSHRGDEDTCPGDGTCNGKGGGPSCDGCPAYNQKHLPHTTRVISTNGARRLTAAERAAAIANGASTDEHGNIIGLIPESAIGPGRIPPNVAAAIAANTSNLSRVISDGSVSASESGSMTAMPATATATGTTSCERAVCFNCGTDYTPLWRRDAKGNIACNACALFFKLHGRNRPISLKRNVIKRRRRGFNKKFASPADGSGIDNGNVHDDTASAAADDDDGDDESISVSRSVSPAINRYSVNTRPVLIEMEPAASAASLSPASASESHGLSSCGDNGGLQSLLEAANMSPPMSATTSRPRDAPVNVPEPNSASNGPIAPVEREPSPDSVPLSTLIVTTSAADSSEVERCREELQRECSRLQALLERSTTLLASLNKAMPPQPQPLSSQSLPPPSPSSAGPSAEQQQ